MTRSSLPVAVIFDWDNTLIDNWDAITDALNLVRSMRGLETWTVEEARVKSARALRVSFPEWFGDWWETARDIFYDHFYKVHIERLKVMNGAPELLDWLHENKVPMFIVSTKKNTLLNAEIDHLGWRHYFVAIMGALDATYDKPHRMPVDLALAKGGLKADNLDVWFAGDSHADIECALRSGCTPVLIGERRIAEKFGVKMHFSDCQAMKTALKGWNCTN